MLILVFGRDGKAGLKQAGEFQSQEKSAMFRSTRGFHGSASDFERCDRVFLMDDTCAQVERFYRERKVPVGGPGADEDDYDLESPDLELLEHFQEIPDGGDGDETGLKYSVPEGFQDEYQTETGGVLPIQDICTMAADKAGLDEAGWNLLDQEEKAGAVEDMLKVCGAIVDAGGNDDSSGGDPDQLAGSELFGETIELAEGEVSISWFATKAFEDSRLELETWNQLDQPLRDKLIADAIVEAGGEVPQEYIDQRCEFLETTTRKELEGKDADALREWAKEKDLEIDARLKDPKKILDAVVEAVLDAEFEVEHDDE